MIARRLSHILSLLLLPALFGCSAQDGSEAPPLDATALAAVRGDPGVSRELLASAVDALFTEASSGETRAVLVIHKGQIVAERYAPGYHENTRFVSWSMAKTVTGVMIGMLVADGRLRLDEPAPVPLWQRPGDPRGEITLRQLLQMRSGLKHLEGGNPIYRSDEVRMLFLDGRDNMAAYAEAQPLAATPGSTWRYSTATTVILCDLAAGSLSISHDPDERRAAVSDYLRTRLFEPLGMRSVLPEYDAAGTMIGSSLIHATARDWGKFGEFMREGGATKGAQLVPSAWIAFMTEPNPRNPGYGAQTWLNHPQKDSGETQFPGAPANVFSLNGHLGQYVVIAPDQELTIVRLGNTKEDEQGPLRERIARLISLFPDRPTP
jgi:CubicO group peptidase (beta-lactamase class C family)